METKDIEDTEMPSIFICPAKQDWSEYSQNTTEHGYRNLKSFIRGQVNSSLDFVSSEGMQNLSFSNVSRQVFNSIDEGKDNQIIGEPEANWETAKKNAVENFNAYDGGFCRKIDVESRIIPKLNWVGLVMPNEDSQIVIADASRSLYTTSLTHNP